MKEHLDAYLSASQLGITFASLWLGWMWEALVEENLLSLASFLNFWIPAEVMHYASVVLGFLVITTFHIVLGEQAPKTLAIRFPLGTSLLIASPLRVFYVVFKPFIWILNTLSLKTLRVFGIPAAKDHDDDVHSEEELRLLVAESEEWWEINKSERELIHNVFDFDDKEVWEVMTHTQDIIAVDMTEPIDVILDKIIKEWYSRVPVYRRSLDDMTWRVLTKDILLAMTRQQKIHIDSFVRPLHFVPETQKISDVLRLFQKYHVQLAIVTSEYGTTVGLVTLEDIVEELVWEIEDEWDDHVTLPVRQISPTSYLISGKCSVSEVNEHLPFPLPEDERYTTVSGFVNDMFGRIPSVKEIWKGPGYDLIVTKRRKQMVEEIELHIHQ